MSDTANSSDPNQGFPNPHSDAFTGTRTPEEELEYRRQQLARDVATGKVDPTTGEVADEAAGAPADAAAVEGGQPPANPTGTPQAAY